MTLCANCPRLAGLRVNRRATCCQDDYRDELQRRIEKRRELERAIDALPTRQQRRAAWRRLGVP